MAIMNMLAAESDTSETLLWIVLVLVAALVVAGAAIICLLIGLRNKIAVQKLKFLGIYAQDPLSREIYAELTVGNKSLNEVALSQIGLRNGKISFDFTAAYKQKAALAPEARIVVEQRSSIKFRLSEEELSRILVDGKKGKVLKKLSIYCVDLTGTCYTGNLSVVRKLAQKVLEDYNQGRIPMPIMVSPAAPEPVKNPVIAPVPATPVQPEPVKAPAPAQPEPAKAPVEPEPVKEPEPAVEPIKEPEPVPAPAEPAETWNGETDPVADGGE